MWKYKNIHYFYPVFCVVLIGSTLMAERFHWWLPLILLLIWFSYITIGAFRLSSGIFLDAVCSGSTSSNTITLTFDDGPDPVITPEILALLKSFNAKAIFFCIGKKIQMHPELIQQIAQEGHIVANHTFHHSNSIGFASANYVQKEIEETENLILQYTQQSHKLFRPPFGVSNPNIARAVQLLNYKVIGWNTRSFDTVSANKDQVLKRISANVQAGDIVLFHDTMQITPSVLKEFMLLVTQKGFNFGIHSEIVH